MGTRLCRLKAQLKGQILSDGKCLSGKNRLTEHEIDNLQSYYGSAIRRNHSSVQNMRQAIWAIFCISYQLMNILNMVFVPSGKIHGVDLKRLKHQATRETCEHSMAEAVREAVDENDGKRDLAVVVDGSWQKRGFSSKNGLVTVTSVDTGKVIDVEAFSKTLYLSEQNKHLQNCKRNFEGYSAFTSIVENKVYGDHCCREIRMHRSCYEKNGTRLRRLKTKMRGQKLSDGKPLCGRNRLTEAEIDRLQAYYGLAIRRNLSSVKDMQQAILFLHKINR
ncbi:uncharacterized protein TNCV_2901901 [Trichonephila clavipes]|nr:uncharacterized protein TNCV_2901901 [Trichonephila clavipes]